MKALSKQTSMSIITLSLMISINTRCMLQSADKFVDHNFIREHDALATAKKAMQSKELQERFAALKIFEVLASTSLNAYQYAMQGAIQAVADPELEVQKQAFILAQTLLRKTDQNYPELHTDRKKIIAAVVAQLADSKHIPIATRIISSLNQPADREAAAKAAYVLVLQHATEKGLQAFILLEPKHESETEYDLASQALNIAHREPNLNATILEKYSILNKILLGQSLAKTENREHTLDKFIVEIPASNSIDDEACKCMIL